MLDVRLPMVYMFNVCFIQYEHMQCTYFVCTFANILLQPYAWEAREFLRKLLVGKEVKFVVEYKPATGSREYGCVWISSDGRNVTDLMLSEGLVEVRQAGVRPSE